MLDKVKSSLRILNDRFDEEILLLINSATRDLISSGINVKYINEEKEDIQLAIITYCKANFGIDNTEFEKYTNSYQRQLEKLAIIYGGNR